MNNIFSILIFLVMMVSPIVFTLNYPDFLTFVTCINCFIFYKLADQTRYHSLQFFYVVFLYLALYPFYIQYITEIPINVTGRNVEPMNVSTFLALNLFLFGSSMPMLFNTQPYLSKFLSIGSLTYYINKKTFTPIIAFVVLCSIFIYLLGADSFFSARNASYDQESKSGLVTFLTNIVKTVPFWIMFFIIWRDLIKGRTPLSLNLLFIFVLAIAINNPSTTARYISLTGLIIAFIPYLVAKHHLSSFKTLFPLLVWLVLPITSLMRTGLDEIDIYAIYNIASSLEFSSVMALNDWLSSKNSDIMSLALYTPSAFLILVPRVIWPGKNTGTGIVIAEELGYSYTNVAVPALIDFYLDLGWLGIFLGGLASGYIFTMFSRIELDRINFFSTVSCFPVILFALVPIFVRGDLSTFFMALYTFILSHRVAIIILRIKL